MVPRSVAQRAASFPLLARRDDEILFRAPEWEVSAAQFLGAAHRLAAELPAGAHVLNLCQGRYAFTLAFAASLLRGQVSLLTSDRSAGRIAELASAYLGTYAVTDDPAQASPVRLHLIGTGGGSSPGAGAVNPLLPARQLAAIVFTSGSTGEPVAHPKSWGALAARSGDAARRFRVARAEPVSIVGMVPPQHMYGFETTVLLPLHVPASIWCGGAFYPSDIEAALAAVPGPGILVTTPLQIRALLQARLNLAPLARVISATAPLLPDMALEAERSWSTRVDEIFGATEVGSIASRRTVEGDVWTMYPRVRLHRGAAEDEVVVAAPYAEPYPLSDAVEPLPNSRFRLLGRRTDLVKLGGKRASLPALTRVLTDIAGVKDGIFVAPDELDREPTARLLAFVVAPDREPDSILAELRDRVDPLFLPRRVVRVDALPRNEFGKLPQRALRTLRARLEES